MYTSGLVAILQHEIRDVWRAPGDGHHCDVTSKCCGVTIKTKFNWVDAVCLRDKFMYTFALFKNCQSSDNTNDYANDVWDKSKRTLAFGIAQLPAVRGGGKHSKTGGRWDFCPHHEPPGELIAQYLPPMSSPNIISPWYPQSFGDSGVVNLQNVQHYIHHTSWSISGLRLVH